MPSFDLDSPKADGAQLVRGAARRPGDDTGAAGASLRLSPRDPLTFALVVGALGGLVLLAAYVPALRATRVDPMLVLRHD